MLKIFHFVPGLQECDYRILVWFSLCFFRLVLVMPLGLEGLYFSLNLVIFLSVFYKYFFPMSLGISVDSYYMYITSLDFVSHINKCIIIRFFFFLFSVIDDQIGMNYSINGWGSGRIIKESGIIGECHNHENWQMSQMWT